MIKFKEINQEFHLAEIVLINTTINKIVKEYNEAVTLTQKRLSVRKIYPIEKKDIEINTVNIFSGGETSSTYVYGVGYVNSKASLGLIAVEKTKRFGLCAKIHIIRTEKARYTSSKTFRYNLERGFYTNYDGLCKLYDNDRAKIAHHIIFKDRISKHKACLRSLLKKRISKFDIAVYDHKIDDIDIRVFTILSKGINLVFEYNLDSREFRTYLTNDYFYDVGTVIVYKGFPTSVDIKEKLLELYEKVATEIENADAILKLTAIVSLFKSEVIYEQANC
jgi:hypothetical protein